MANLVDYALNNIKNTAGALFNSAVSASPFRAFQNPQVQQGIQNTFQQAGFNQQQGIQNNPIQNVATGIGRAQNFVESNRSFQPVPQFTPFTGNNVQSNIGNFAFNLPGNILNSTVAPTMNFSNDVGSSIGRAIGGRQQQDYTQLKSPGTRLIANAMGDHANPSEILGNIGGVGSDILSTYMPSGAGGLAKEVLEQSGRQAFIKATKEAAINGAKYMGLQGGLEGLNQGRGQDLPHQLLSGVQGGVQGAVTGLVTGGVLGGGSHIYGAFREAFPKASKELQAQAAQMYQRDVQTGRFKASMDSGKTKADLQDWVRSRVGKGANEPVFQSDLQQALQGGFIKPDEFLPNKPFVPSTEWQEVPKGVAVPPGGNFRLDMKNNKSYARWDNPPSSLNNTEGIKVYRGSRTGEPIDVSRGSNNGISVSLGREPASRFGDVSEHTIDSNAKILKFEDIPAEFIRKSPGLGLTVSESAGKNAEGIVRYARENGYDAVDLRKFGEGEIRVLNPKILKSTQPLSSDGTVTRKGVKISNTPTQTEIKNRAEVNAGRPDLYTQRKAAIEGNGEPLPWETTPQGENMPLSKPGAEEIGKNTELQTQTYPQSSESNQGKTPLQPGQLPNTQPLEDIVRSSGIDVKDKINILDGFRTPDRVMEKVGLGKEMKMLRDGYETYQKELPGEINKITEWSKQVPPESNQRIFQHLDGQNVALNPQEAKVAGEIRGYLKTWADRLGLPNDKRITNYITHIFDNELVQKEFDPDLAKLIQDKVSGSVYDPFTEQRLGKQGYKEDTWAALDAYVKRATRKVNLDPALKQIKGKAENLESSQFDYVKNFIDRVNMRPTKTDNLVDNTVKQVIGYKFGQRPTTVLTQKLRQAVYRGTLGLNPGSALKNLSQGANTYAKLGEKYTVLGYTGMVKSILTKSDELERVGVLGQDMVQDRVLSAVKQKLQNSDKRLFSFFEGAERINRGAAYFGAKSKALSEGKTEEQAIEYAKKIVRDTQFTFGSIDTPTNMQSDLMKTFGQFQSYNVKQAEFLGEMVKNKEFAGLVRYAGSSLVFALTVGKLFGMKPTDMIPFYGFISGDQKIGETPITKMARDVATLPLNQKDKYGNELNMGDKLKTLGSDAIPFIPGGSQLKKSITGFQAVNQGGKYNKKGDQVYPIEQSTSNYVRGSLFGPNNLPEAQDHFNNPKKSSSTYTPPPPTNQASAAESIPTAPTKDNQPVTEMQKVRLKAQIKDLDNQEKAILTNQHGANILGHQFGKAALTEDQQNEALSKLEEQKKALSNEMSANPKDLALEATKAKVKETGQPQTVGNTVYYKNGNSVASIDTYSPIYKPQLSGNPTIDRLELAKQASSYTSKINDVVKLYELGQMPVAQASNLIQQLQQQEKIVQTRVKGLKGTGGRKGRKMKLKKMRFGRPSTPKLSKVKLPSFSLSGGATTPLKTSKKVKLQVKR